MMHFLCVNPKKLKRVPKRLLVVWVLLLLFGIYCLTMLFVPKYQKLNNISECQITIKSIRLIDTHNSNGSRFRLYIQGNNQSYYLDYPQLYSKEYLNRVKEELLTGEIELVDAKYVDNYTIRDRILGRKRIVDLRTNNSVYYELEMEKKQLSEYKISACVLFFLVILVWIIYSLFIIGIYGLLGRTKEQSEVE